MKKRHIVWALLWISLFSCFGKKHVSTPEEYLKYISNEESGLVKTKYVNGLFIQVRYLPADYLSWKEFSKESYSKNQKDSIAELYKHSLCFMLTLGTDERKEKKGDVMYKGVTQYKEYVERSHTMNFEMQQFIKVMADGKEYRPVLSSMDNVYSLENKRNILLVFVPADKSDRSIFTSKELDFVYEDELFALGVNHFLFKRDAFDNIPAFPNASIEE